MALTRPRVVGGLVPAAVGLGALSVGLVLVLHTTPGCGSAAFPHVTNGIGPDACTDARDHGGGVGFPLLAAGALMLLAGGGRAVYLRRSLWV